MSQLESVWLKKIKILYQVLLVSLSLNVGLILAFTYKGVKNGVKKLHASESVTVNQPSKLAVIQSFFELSFDELVAQLSSKEHIEDGFTYRDIALSCLIHYHDFAIDRVYLSNSVEKRDLILCKESLSETVKVPLLLGLTNDVFQSIINFIKTERYPVTLKGLVFLLKDIKNRAKFSEIARLIYIQEPFCALYATLKNLEVKLKKDELLQLIVSGPFELFEGFSEGVYSAKSNTLELCRKYLLSYLEKNSICAARLLLKLDADYCVHQLDQEQIIKFIHLCNEPNLEVVLILKRILCSMRATHVHEAAARKLYAFCGIKFKEPYEHKEALKYFLPNFYSKYFVPPVKTP
jgi:hypothetical protein